MVAATIPVLAPAVYVSITIEAAADGDDIHIHAGGQGVWVARMLRHLGHPAAICAPLGGEIGQTLRGLIDAWDLDLLAVETVAGTPSYVHDRRDGERDELARSPLPVLRRHESDELYDHFLELALDAGRCVVTGPEDVRTLEPEVYRRLGKDLAAADVEVVADLHGEVLDAFMDGGRLAILKLSTGDLVDDGRIDDDQRDDEEVLDRIADELIERGVRSVVISRGDEPIHAVTPDGRFRITGPSLDPVDTKGSGDSMTAALASALSRGEDTRTTLARAWAAGAANVTRRGLGSATAGLIDQLTGRADVQER